MKRELVLFLAATLSIGFSTTSFASDWDVAGKVLTGVEGLRILTGGKVDVIGNIAGIRDKQYAAHKGHRTHAHGYHRDCQRTWIPHFVWKKQWIPAHKEYDAQFGEIIVEGHYIKYKVRHGGQWSHACDDEYSGVYGYDY